MTGQDPGEPGSRGDAGPADEQDPETEGPDAADAAAGGAETSPPPRVIPLSRFRASLARPRGMRRLEALLEAANPTAAVQALSVPDFYFLVKEVGLSDALELIELAAPEQLRGCLDLEIWDRDRIKLDATGPWLAALAEAGTDTLGRIWPEFDPELRALILAGLVRVYDHSLGEVAPEDDDRPRLTTPDTFFTVIITAPREDQVRLAFALIDQLYRADMQLARHTLMSARSELPSELEEMSYRWRSGRMADLGYADFYEALEVFQPLDPESIAAGEAGWSTAGPREAGAPREAAASGLPAPVAEPMAGSFLARALERVSDGAEAERLEAALLLLVNRVLSALRVSPGDEAAVRAASLRAAATASLGLEHATAGQLDLAAAALAHVSLTRLHRAGHTLTLRLARMARLLAPRALTAGEPTAQVLEALLSARPQMSAALDRPPGRGVRPIASLADLRTVAQHLTALTARMALAEALGVNLLAMAQAPEPRPELDDHVRTALARVLAGGELDAAPLEPANLAALEQRMVGGRIAPEQRGHAVRALLALAERHNIAASPELLSGLAGTWLDEVEGSARRLITSADKS